MTRFRKMIWICLIVCLFSAQLVYASTTYTSAKTWSLTAGSGFSTMTTSGNKLKSTKTTDEPDWRVYTVAKTMVTAPKARLVNSEGDVRSDTLTTASTGNSVSSTANTGVKGYYEYLSVKPSALQVGTDTIKLKFKNY